MAENDVGATIVAVTTANATSTSVDNDDFEVVGGNLKLKDGASLDFEAADEVVVEITASGAGASATHTVTITVTDINEAPMIAEVDGSGSAGGVTASSTVSENSTDAIPGMAGAVLGLVKLSDPDAGQTHTVAVDDDRFQVIDHVGAKWLTLRPGVSLDYEKDGPEVMVKLTVTDDGDPALSSDSEYVFTVNVTDVRETPGITVAGDGDADSTAGDIIASFTVAENSGDVVPGVAGAVLGLITLSDVDSGEVIDDDDFKVSGDTDDRFQVITHAGARWLTLKSGMSLDFEKDGPTVDLTVTVTDPDGNSGSVPVPITVTDVNEAPTISVADGTTPDNKPASSTVAENAKGALLGQIRLSDPDKDDMHNVEVVGDERFEATKDDEGGWWLKLKDEASLDHEAAATVPVTVRVTDSGEPAQSASAEVTITVTDVNEAPTAPQVGTAMVSIDENKLGAPLTVVSGSSDPEGDDFKYEVNNEDFEITADGILKLKDTASLDFEAGGTVVLEVTAVDGFGNRSASAEVTVAVGDIAENRAPTISVADGATPDNKPASSTVAENVKGALLGQIRLSDPDKDDMHNVEVVGDERFEATKDDEGGWWLKLKDEASLDHEAAATVAVTVKVTDSGEPAQSDSAEVTITVTDVNEAPTISVADGTTPDNKPASSTVPENAKGALLGQIRLSDPDKDDMHNVEVVGDERFEATKDDEGGWWLKLKDEASLNHEAAATVAVTVKVTDSGEPAQSDSAEVTITVTDVNEAPVPTMATMEGGEPKLLLVERDEDGSKKDGSKKAGEFEVVAGEGINKELDLAAMFEDEDGDTLFTYELQNAPDWLKLNRAPSPENGPRWMLEGTPPSSEVPDPLTATVTLVARDSKPVGAGEEEMGISFKVIWEDGNDKPYDLIFKNKEGKEVYQTDEAIPENMPGMGTGLFVFVTDDDNPDHKFGKVKLETSDERFEVDGPTGEIRLKSGQQLDFEGDAGSISLAITATDGGMLSVEQTVIIDIKNGNDAPTKGDEPGNWWVVVDKMLDEDDVTDGSWLSFFIEEPDDARPLFKDEDGEVDLTYMLKNSPSWLKIDKDTGKIENVEGMLPTRGVHSITVVATDNGDNSVEQTFKLAVAFSAPNDEGNDNQTIIKDIGWDTDENSTAGTELAAFTVQDNDWDLADGGHPYAPRMPTITVVQPSSGGTDGTSWSDDQIKERLEVKKVGRHDTDSQDYQIVTVGDNKWLDHELVDKLEITVSVEDGLPSPTLATEIINLDIKDLNEPPMFGPEDGRSTNDGRIANREQQEDQVQVIYLNLTRLFVDSEDGMNNRDDLTFGQPVELPDWMKALHGGVRKWEDIVRATEDDGDDAVTGATWADGGGTAPEDGDHVLILSVDRTADAKGEDGQLSVGDHFFSVRVTDKGNRPFDYKFEFSVTDENVAPAGAAGSGLAFASNIREGQRVTVGRFKEEVDEDFEGDHKPVAVLYQILTAGGEPGTPDEVVKVSVDKPEPYEVKQSDVGGLLRGQVTYFEVFDGSIVQTTSSADNNQLFKDSSVVNNVNDRGTGTFEFETTATTDEIRVTARVIDEDVGGVVDLNPGNYQWQYSETGNGNWQDFDDGDTTATITADQAGKYVRVIVTYDGAHGNTERNEEIRSEAIKVGKVGEIVTEDLAAPMASATSGSEAAIGSTLRLPSTVGRNADIQWFAAVGSGEPMPISGATEREFVVTQAQAGLSITVEVREKNADGGLTSVATSSGITVEGEQPANVAPTGEDISNKLGAAPTEVGELVSLKSGPIDFANMFSDFNEDKLTYELGIVRNFGTLAENVGDDLDVWLTDASPTEGNGLLIIDPDTGEVWYHTTRAQNHDGDDTDGAGNWIQLTFTANDGRDGIANANADLRIDVAATGVEGSTGSTGNARFALTFNIQEDAKTTGNNADGGTLAINILDQNEGDHPYGQYDWVKAEVSDTRFEVVGDRNDGSKATLRLKAGEKLGNVNAEKEEKITIKVKPKGDIQGEVTITVTAMIQNTDSSIAPEETTPDANDVPGLKDDDGDNNDIEEGGDDDQDGGTLPPMLSGTGMSVDSLGGVLVQEGDLLDDFALMIDDLIDAA